MSKARKHKHIHVFHAYLIIGVTLGIAVWLVSLANPVVVNADDNITLNELLNEKDHSIEHELLKPEVILSTENSNDEIITKVEENTVLNNLNTDILILPNNKNQSVDSIITVLFKEPVSLEYFSSALTITPNVLGSYNIKGNIGTFTPKNPLAPQTTYNVSYNDGINTYSSVFDTRPVLHILAVPYHRQQYARSCEAASLRMALEYLGTFTNDMEIVNLAGYIPTEPNWSERTWDNPYEMFVGFISGKQVGYGMYASALSKSAIKLGHNAQVLENPSIQDIAEAIWNDKPVVAWGYINDTIPKLSYFNTDNGQRVPIYSNEHARVIVGVVGSPKNPVGFYLHDPLSGVANEYWSAEKLQKHMSIFGSVSNQILIVE